MLGRRERRRQRREAQQQENNSSGKNIVKTVIKTVFMPHNAVTTTIRCAKLGVKVVSKLAGSHEDVSSHEPEHTITSSQHISKSTPDLRPTCPNWTSSSPSPNMCPPQDFTSSTMMTFPHSSTRALSPNTASSSSPAYWGVTDPLPNVSSTASSTRSNSPSVPPNTPYEPVSNPFAGPYLHPMALATYYEN